MIRITIATLLLGVPALAASCESLATLQLPGTTISLAQLVPAGEFKPPAGGSPFEVTFPYKNVPAFCRVTGSIKPTSDSDIRFEVWMPASGWNGKMQGMGNGGFAGALPVGQMGLPVARGYAVAATDTGHSGGDAKWALGHPEKVIDFGHRAIHETAVKAKAIIRQFYGNEPRHSYFSSCSNGGRQALTEAQRYPADYDGIIAGAPANYWTHHFAGFLFDVLALSEPGAYIPAVKLKAIEAAVNEACDARDGVSDGIVDNPVQCHFDPSKLLCKGPESDGCLTAPQITALNKIYAGPKTSKGERIFRGYEPGGENGLGGWTIWILGNGGPDKSGHFMFGSQFFTYMVMQDASWDYKKFQIEKDVVTADEKTAGILNSTDPNLKAFRERGGKLILYHGWSDAAIPPLNTVDYYSAVIAGMPSADANQFVRLFMAPGMQHCFAGPGPNNFGQLNAGSKPDPEHDVFLALDRWVETGVAPESVVAAKQVNDFDATKGIVRTRPLCAYPKVARWKGTGSTDDATNFACVDDPGPAK